MNHRFHQLSQGLDELDHLAALSLGSGIESPTGGFHSPKPKGLRLGLKVQAGCLGDGEVWSGLMVTLWFYRIKTTH